MPAKEGLAERPAQRGAAGHGAGSAEQFPSQSPCTHMPRLRAARTAGVRLALGNFPDSWVHQGGTRTWAATSPGLPRKGGEGASFPRPRSCLAQAPSEGEAAGHGAGTAGPLCSQHGCTHLRVLRTAGERACGSRLRACCRPALGPLGHPTSRRGVWGGGGAARQLPLCRQLMAACSWKLSLSASTHACPACLPQGAQPAHAPTHIPCLLGGPRAKDAAQAAHAPGLGTASFNQAAGAPCPRTPHSPVCPPCETRPPAGLPLAAARAFAVGVGEGLLREVWWSWSCPASACKRATARLGCPIGGGGGACGNM